MWGSGGRSVAVDIGGHVYAIGSGSYCKPEQVYGLIQSDILALELDSEGNLVGELRIGDSGNDFGSGVAVDSAGSIYVTGTFSEAVNLDPSDETIGSISAGGTDIFVAKFSSFIGLVYGHDDSYCGSPGEGEGEGEATFTISPATVKVDQFGGEKILMVSVNATREINWTASIKEGHFLSLEEPHAGTGAGNVVVSVGPNTEFFARRGVVEFSSEEASNSPFEVAFLQAKQDCEGGCCPKGGYALNKADSIVGHGKSQGDMVLYCLTVVALLGFSWTKMRGAESFAKHSH